MIRKGTYRKFETCCSSNDENPINTTQIPIQDIEQTIIDFLEWYKAQDKKYCK